MNIKDFRKYIDEDKQEIFVCSMCSALGRNYKEKHHSVIYENLENNERTHKWLCEEHLRQLIDLNPDTDSFTAKLLKVLHSGAE